MKDRNGTVNRHDVDVVVIGAGLIGSAAAWSISSRGASVQMLEQGVMGHCEGSSHGSSRIFRRGYSLANYVTMTGMAQRLWAELSGEYGKELLLRTGGLDTGSERGVREIHSTFRSEGVACELLSGGDVAERWPGMSFRGEVLYHPEAAVLNADEVVRAMVECALARGAKLRQGIGAHVERVESTRDGAVVHLSEGVIRARVVVVAAGAWLKEVLPADVSARLPRTTVTQQQVFHFAHREPRASWPVFICKERPGDEIYGVASGTDGGGRPAFKVAEHGHGTVTTARMRDGVVDVSSRRRVTDFVAQRLPGLIPDVVAESTCLYTNTEDKDFVLDRAGAVVVASACSGHGAKFAPAVGEILADLALRGRTQGGRFALRPEPGSAGPYSRGG